MNNLHIKIGDKVKLKTREQLIKEFGLDWNYAWPGWDMSMDLYFTQPITIQNISYEQGIQMVSCNGWLFNVQFLDLMPPLPINFIGEREKFYVARRR